MIHLLGHALSVIPSADLVLSLIIKRRQSCVDRARQKVPSIRCELMSIRGSPRRSRSERPSRYVAYWHLAVIADLRHDVC